MRIKRRVAAAVLAFLPFAPLPAAAKTTLAFWTFLPMQGADPRSQALREVVDGFNAAQGDYEVQVQSIDFARIDNQVIQATAAGRGPDILNVNTDLLPMHAAAGTVRPLDGYVARLPADQRGDFVIPLDFLTIGGHQMAIPWEVRVWLLWYRADLLAKAGKEMPKTLDELAQDATAMSGDHLMGFAMGASSGQLGAGVVETFTPLLWGAGGHLVGPDGSAAFNSAAGVRTLTYLRDLVTRYKAMGQNVVTMTADDVLSAVKAGTAASTFQGSFRVSAARNAAATGENLHTAPIPGWTADQPTPARLAAQTLAIGASSKSPDGAWTFIQYYIGHAGQLAFAHAGVMPSRKSSYQDAMFKENVTGQEIAGWSDYATRYGRLELMPADFPKLSAALAAAVQQVLIRGADPKAALDEAAANYNTQHKE